MQTQELDAPKTPVAQHSQPPLAPAPDRQGLTLARQRSWLEQRVYGLPPWLVISQLFFGLGWARAAAAKVISIDWWTGATIDHFVADHETVTVGWASWLAQTAAANTVIVALMVLLTQLFIAGSFLTNRALGSALAAAAALNLTFLAIGAVDPSAFYLFGQGVMALWLVGRRPPSAPLSRMLRFAVAASVALAAISIPSIATIHPAEVIHDPAVMVAFISGLAAVSLELTHRAVFGYSLP